MHLDDLQVEQVEAVFARHGALSITLTDAADDPVLEPAPGETPLWTSTRITGLFPNDADLLSLREDLLLSFELDDLPATDIETLAERAWEREWLKDFRPMRFGDRLWVCPRDSLIDDDDAVVVRLDPGLAFGTGTHETTALCLEWLDGIDVAGKRVLDVGCGSGILSIAALQLGAASVDAIDIDAQAIAATHANADENGVGDRLTATVAMDQVADDYDIVLANILAGTLQKLAEDISKRTVHGGKIALSGILSDQTDSVCSAYVRWFTLDRPVVSDGWARITGIRR